MNPLVYAASIGMVLFGLKSEAIGYSLDSRIRFFQTCKSVYNRVACRLKGS